MELNGMIILSFSRAWCEGKTGVPVVDAGMRQLNKTGYMHNRARLITANYLNRILGCDWRLERSITPLN